MGGLKTLAAAVLLTSCLVLLAHADTEINFNFAHMIPPAEPCKAEEECEECANKCATRTYRKAGEPSIFATLTPEEYASVEEWLLAQPEFDLTDHANATLSDNYIFYITSLPPPKAEALAYLDQDGPRPGRYALAVIYFCKREEVREYKVGPLPISEATTATRWDTVTYMGEADFPFNSRVPDSVEYDAIYASVLAPMAERLDSIFRESFNASKTDCGEGFCLYYSDSAPRNNETHINTRQTWFFWMYALDGAWVQNVPFETLVLHNSTDPNEFELLMIVYNGHAFYSVDELIGAYNNNSVPKVQMTPDEKWSSFRRQGRAFPGDTRPGAKQIDPAGRRYTITGDSHVEWLGWSFDWSMHPLNGITFWDIRFFGERIIYELSSEEIYVPYSGRNPSQANSFYLDTAWGYGASTFPLIPGVDCPNNAAYLDFTQFYDTSNPNVHRNGICVFEQDVGIASRRHFEPITGDTVGTAGRALVVRSAATAYNYDYILDHLFYPTGNTEVVVSASGYLQATAYSAEESQYGSPRVGPYTSGTLHQHLFAFKVDMDVLGAQNTMRVTTFPQETYDAPWFAAPKTRPVSRHQYVQSESESAFTPSYDNPMIYAFVNKGQTNSWGVERAYVISSTNYMKHLYEGVLGESVSWAKYHIAVTKRKDEEPSLTNAYAQARGFEYEIGSRRMRADNESLEQEDLVAWVNIGVVHLPHSEDIPVTITHVSHASFTIKPVNYFDRDPASGLRDTVIARYTGSGVAELEVEPGQVRPAEDCVYHTDQHPVYEVEERVAGAPPGSA